MNQIERYIFRRIFLLAMGILIVTTILAMTTQILLYVNLLTSTGQSLMTYAKLALMLMPKVMVIVMPFALLIASGYTLSGMNEDSELVVIEGAGAPPRVVALPIMLIAIGMSVFTLYSNHFIEPAANRQVRNIVSNASGDLLSSAIQTSTFTRLDDGVYFDVSGVGSGGELHGIFISDNRDKTKSLAYYAKSGQLIRSGSDQVLVLQDGQAQNKDLQTGKVSIIKFKSYALDLALFPADSHVTHYYPKEDPTAYLFSPDPNDPYYKARPDLFVEQIYKRFSEWMYPLLFGLIAISFMGKAHSSRTGRAQYEIMAFAVALFYRAAGFYVEPELGGSLIFAILTFVVPAFGILSYGALILMERQISLPQGLLDAITDGFHATTGSLGRAGRRMLPGRHGGPT